MKTVIKNISKLIQTESKLIKFKAGHEMSKLNTIEDAYIEIKEGRITEFGSMDNWKGISDWNNTTIIDAEDGMVFPSFCDSHTHLVYPKSRENEFNDRINGLSYEEIAKNGGGILNSAKTTQEISEEELYEKSLDRLINLISLGTGAIEIKSGYGLNTESELKILKVIKRLKEKSPIPIKSTFLGAHALPENYKNQKEEYLDLIINEMLPEIDKQGLADYIDIFCEQGYFNTQDTIRLLNAGKKYGLKGKTHVNQFNSIGGVKASIDNGALSVDHLEIMKEEDYLAFNSSECIATLLPSCSFFLGIPYSPAQEFIKRNIPFNLASDYNPGSSPSGNMNFISSLGSIKLQMNAEQVINATTINGAYAMGLENELGSITIGKKANLFITKPIPSYQYLHYSFGENLINKIIIEGKEFKK
ncbi:MAG: imidazolonepropionase [Flavobacteriales bacterium]|nr:imidazolonepropionase [Flavobacteriales bacterium]